jgi:hypothetical protein
MKKIILAVLLVVIMAVPAMALDFLLVDAEVKDNISALYTSGDDNGVGAAGVFIGPLGRVVHNGHEIMAIGGFNFAMNANNDLMFGVTPVTFFGDMIQISVMMDPNDFQFNNDNSYKLGIGISATSVVNKIWR